MYNLNNISIRENKTLSIHNNKISKMFSSQTLELNDNHTSIVKIPDININVTVSSSKYHFDGSLNNQTINVPVGLTTILNLSDSTNTGHPLLLNTTVDGTHSGASVYTQDITYELDGVAYTPTNYANNFNTATVRKVIITPQSFHPAPAGFLYYYCFVHPGMGAGSSVSTSGAVLQVNFNTPNEGHLNRSYCDSHSETINGNKKSYSNSNQITTILSDLTHPKYENKTVNTHTNYSKTNLNDSNFTYSKNSTIHTSGNSDLIIRLNSQNYLTNNYSKFTDNYNRTVIENYNLTTEANHTTNIYGDYDISISPCGNVTTNINTDNNTTISKNKIESMKNLTLINNNNITNISKSLTRFNQNLNKDVHGSNSIFINSQNMNMFNYNVAISANQTIKQQNKHNVNITSNINIISSGGLQISSNINHSLQLNSNVGISNSSTISNIPYNLTTSILSSYFTDTGTETNTFVIEPVYSFVLITLDTNNTLAQSYMNKDLYIRFNLLPGKYNGQQIKIGFYILFIKKFFDNVNDNSYNSIDKRLNNNLNTDIIIRVDSLCDTNTNEFVTS